MAGQRGGGFFKRLYDASIDVILRKQTVGFDKQGNKYFKYFDSLNGEQIERREVKWAAGEYWNYDPNAIPSEWRMWLRKLRDDPPTEEELEKSAFKAETLRQKVAALDEAERLRQMRMQQQGSSRAPAAPDMPRLLQQMAGDGAGTGLGASRVSEHTGGAAPKGPSSDGLEAWVPQSK